MSKQAIVTGSDSGIGRATAQRLARDGYDVGVTYRSDAEGARVTASLVAEEGRTARVRQMDLAALPDAAEVVDELAGDLGGLDVLVNNAGRGPDAPFLDVALDDFRDMVEVDLTGAFACSQRAVPWMTGDAEAGGDAATDAGGGSAGGKSGGQARDHDAAGGRIVNVTSIHEQVPLPGAAAYCAAKGGLAALTKVMALELAGHGITVNAVAPGEIATPMTDQHEAEPDAQQRPGIPLGRPGGAHEMAAIITFLASDDAGYVTGQSWVADGGMLLMAAVR